MSYITCKDLTLGYESQIVAEKINFGVNEGDYLCIVGENGAGKSTLVKTLLRLTSPAKGEIIYSSALKKYEIGYLPQQTVVQKDFPASVMEIVLSGTLSKCKWKPFYGRKEKELAKLNMEKMEIWHLRKKCYRKLSGGQQQRVLLARALCAAKKILLLDEPVAGLDPKVTADFYKTIKKLNHEGITIIMVSHDIHAAINYATHILHLEKEKSFYGTTKEYLNSQEWKEFQNIGGEENE